MTSSPHLRIRHATLSDTSAVIRLAALDSTRVPSGELLVAELDGELVAALSVDTGAVVADPFVHTVAIVESLREHAAQSERPPVLPGRLGRVLVGRA